MLVLKGTYVVRKKKIQYRGQAMKKQLVYAIV